VSEDEVRAIAQKFATALDQNDFAAVAALLSADCRYELTKSEFTSETSLVGPAAIIESYRWHDTRARAAFDRVEYSSCVEGVENMSATIRFTDALEKAALRHVYECRQHVTIKSGKICLIVQEDIPEGKAAIREFMKRVGVQL